MSHRAATNRTRATSRALRAGVLAGLASVAVALPACRGDRTELPPRQFFPDMDQQPKWGPQGETEFYADGRTQRPDLAGRVPFGRTSHDPAVLEASDWAGWLAEERAEMLADDDAIYRGVRYEPDPTGVNEPAEAYLDYIPVPVTNEMIMRGKERFNIFCATCHGYTGVGDGPVGQLWSYPPANLQAEQYRDRAQRQGKDGYLFHVTRNGVINAAGVVAMKGYGEKLDVADSWAVVAYIRALQTSQNATEADVPAEFRPATSASSGAAGAGTGVMTASTDANADAGTAGGEE